MSDRLKELERLVRSLVDELNAYNAPDQLDGYLDTIGEDFNADLEALEMPTVTVLGPK